MPTLRSKRDRRLVNLVLFLLGMGAMAFVVMRAHCLSLTHDEAYTFIHYLGGSWRDIILYRVGPPIPNNHVLNTLAMKFSQWLLGPGVFNLRLPNVLMAGLYFWHAALLAKQLRHPLAQILGFVVLSAHVYLFDFFALARGYGMGLAFLMAAIYHFSQYRQREKGHHTYRTLIFAALAAYANFTFLYAYLALVPALLVLAFADGDKDRLEWWKLSRAIGVVSLVLGLAVYFPLRTIQNHLFGGNAGFWKDTVHSLIWRLLYEQDPQWVPAIASGVATLILLAAVLWVYDIWLKPSFKKPYYQDLLLWLVLMVSGQILQHFWLKTEYLSGRTALVHLPLFLALLLFCMERLHALTEQWWPKVLVLGGLTVLLLSNFFGKANLTHTLTWRYDRYSQEVLPTLDAHRRKLGLDSVQMGSQWLYEPSLNAYRKMEEAYWLGPLVRHQWTDQQQYFLLMPGDDQAQWEQVARENWTLIKGWPDGMSLYLRPLSGKNSG